MYFNSNCPVIVGPVFGILPSSSPSWAKKGKFFSSSWQRSGSAVESFYTGNTLMERKLFDAHGVRFDEVLAFKGGSDSMLSAILRAEGVKFIWCQEAIVYEDIPEQRVTLKWFVMRRFRVGNISAYINKRLSGEKGFKANFSLVFRYLIYSFANLLFSIFKGNLALIKSIGYFATSLGVVSQIINLHYDEYEPNRYRI
jgi:hypothetical protein